MMKKSQVFLLLRPAGSMLKPLIFEASVQLEEAGFGRMISSEEATRGLHLSGRILLVESGFEPSYLETLSSQGIEVNHHLLLRDLGLEEDAETNAENVELVKDGMIAECVIIDSQFPQFNCPCCGG